MVSEDFIRRRSYGAMAQGVNIWIKQYLGRTKWMECTDSLANRGMADRIAFVNACPSLSGALQNKWQAFTDYADRLAAEAAGSADELVCKIDKSCLQKPRNLREIRGTPMVIL